MNYPLKYPQLINLNKYNNMLSEYARLKFEYGADAAQIGALMSECEQAVRGVLDRLQALPVCDTLAASEPDGLDAIRALRPEGPRALWTRFDAARYNDKLRAALLGRFAGCTLGAPVEFWSVGDMRDWAAWIGDAFPPTDYWSAIKRPNEKRYGVSECRDYTRPFLNGVPVDDDVTYTILGLLILEDYGADFTIDDVGKAWVKYLPYACTAEEVALNNLKAGVDAMSAADKDNPYVQWIGADIRSDPWGYAAPGLPQLAAELAYRDAYISHRRNGIYGEMYFSAAIAAAFETDDAIEALRVALNEIPANCMLADDVRWALEAGKDIHDYMQARAAVEQRFGDMSGVHTNLNACLTIFGLMIGGGDFTKVIGETVAMGYDNDCTAATAGSIAGAAMGMKGIPEKWYKPFNDKVLTYINGHPELSIDDVVNRFTAVAKGMFK